MTQLTFIDQDLQGGGWRMNEHLLIAACIDSDITLPGAIVETDMWMKIEGMI